jgi:small subunit ribosomal protein S16
MCAMDKRAPRDGKVLEELGWFDPIGPEDKQTSLKLDRIDYWLSVGAQPSDTCKSLIRKAGGDPTSGKKLEQTEA